MRSGYINIAPYLDTLEEKRKLVLISSTATEKRYYCPVCGGNKFKVNLKSGKFACYANSCNRTRILCTLDFRKVILDNFYKYREENGTYPFPVKYEKIDTPILIDSLQLDIHQLAIPNNIRVRNDNRYYYAPNLFKIKYKTENGKAVIPYTDGKPGKHYIWPLYMPYESYSGDYLLCVEGEKDVDNCVSQLGIAAFTFASYSREDIIEGLKSLSVKGIYILNDNDPEGRNKQLIVASLAKRLGIDFSLLYIKDIWNLLTDIPITVGSDISDLINIINDTSLFNDVLRKQITSICKR